MRKSSAWWCPSIVPAAIWLFRSRRKSAGLFSINNATIKRMATTLKCTGREYEKLHKKYFYIHSQYHFSTKCLLSHVASFSRNENCLLREAWKSSLGRDPNFHTLKANFWVMLLLPSLRWEDERCMRINTKQQVCVYVQWLHQHALLVCLRSYIGVLYRKEITCSWVEGGDHLQRETAAWLPCKTMRTNSFQRWRFRLLLLLP